VQERHNAAWHFSVHINGSAFSPIGAGGNAILSGTTAVSTSSAGSITFYTGGNQRMGIDNSGKVGIGTGIPTSPLTVSGSMIELTNGFKTLKLQTSGGSIDFRGNNADLYINNFPGPATPSNTYINPGGGYVGIDPLPQRVPELM